MEGEEERGGPGPTPRTADAALRPPQFTRQRVGMPRSTGDVAYAYVNDYSNPLISSRFRALW